VRDEVLGAHREREKAINEWSIRVYQQLQAGYGTEAIRSQFGKLEDATPEDIAKVIAKAKDRYLGYYEFEKLSNRESAKYEIMFGLLFVILMAAFVHYMGWSTAPRQNGRLVWFALVGVAFSCYGLWNWINAEPSGKRSDLEQL
jgi:hypothetical protein